MSGQEEGERTGLKRCHEETTNAEKEGAIKRVRRKEGEEPACPPMPPSVFACVLPFLPWGALSALRRVNRWQQHVLAILHLS
jgi:hypothetical protein